MQADPQPLRDSAPLTGDGQALRKRAREDGYLLLRGLPGPGAVAPLRALVGEVAEALGFLLSGSNGAVLRARPGAALSGSGYDDPRWLTMQQRIVADPRFTAVGDHPRLLEVLEILLREPPLTRRGDICRIALPRAPHLTTRAHQDHWYTGGSTSQWTAWIPLTDVPLDLGPLAVLPGSHRNGLLRHDGEGSGRQGVHLPGDTAFAAAPLAAGDTILFHCLTVHCALPNVTRGDVRLSVDYRYQRSSEPLDSVRLDGTRAGEPGWSAEP